jgi:hypothetical protein
MLVQLRSIKSPSSVPFAASAMLIHPPASRDLHSCVVIAASTQATRAPRQRGCQMGVVSGKERPAWTVVVNCCPPSAGPPVRAAAIALQVRLVADHRKMLERVLIKYLWTSVRRVDTWPWTGPTGCTVRVSQETAARFEPDSRCRART